MTTPRPDAELAREILTRMLRIRFFEENATRMSSEGIIPGSIHTSVGQEASTVGACMALADGDLMLGNHRSHGHPLGKGARPAPLMAELLGRRTGVNRGKGGSMHLADFSVGSLGETSIVGSGIPVATGAALGAKLQGTGQVVLCFFGDGASNEGAFHEGLNLAAVWKLPVVFVCENNGYGATTSAQEVMAITDVADRAASYAMPGRIVDGQDVMAVHREVGEAVAAARSGAGPTLVETKTYRYDNHAVGLFVDDYRTIAEIDLWRQRDPITLFRAYLAEHRILSKSAMKTLEDQTRDEIDAAVAFGLDSPFPEPAEAFEFNFVEQDAVLPETTTA